MFRQELVRRGAFDIPEDQVNFKSLLQRLMTELVAEEAKSAELRSQVVADETASKLEQAKLEREKKKQEALERSRQRQADPDYFKRRAQQNEEASTQANKVDDKSVECVAEVGGEGLEEKDDVFSDDEGNDPFRTYKSKSRSKVFVK